MSDLDLLRAHYCGAAGHRLGLLSGNDCPPFVGHHCVGCGGGGGHLIVLAPMGHVSVHRGVLGRAHMVGLIYTLL